MKICTGTDLGYSFTPRHHVIYVHFPTSGGKRRAAGKNAVFVRVSERMQQSKRKYQAVISLEENIRGRNGKRCYVWGGGGYLSHPAPNMGH